MRVGDHVRIRLEAAVGAMRELRGEVGRVGEVADDGARCTVVYEAWGCLLWDVDPAVFEPADETVH